MKCLVCGAEKVKGSIVYGKHRTDEFWACPQDHEGIPFSLVVEERTGEGLGWAVVLCWGQDRRLLSAGHSEFKARRIRDELAEHGKCKTGRKNPGWLVLPESAARQTPGFKELQQERRETATKEARIKKAAPQPSRRTRVAESTEDKPKKKRSSAPVDPAVGEQVVKLRHEDKLSWRIIANQLDLGSPGKARAVYTAHTGRPHNEAPDVIRATKSRRESDPAATNPVFQEDAEYGDIKGAFKKGAKVEVKYSHGTIETYEVGVFKGLQEESKGMVVNFQDSDGKYRSPALRQIVGVR